jgi:hypothetical protein
MNAPANDSFIEALSAAGPDPAHADKLNLYGRFVGRWDADLTTHGPSGTRHSAPGEIHFGWVLEGRAIQDVWMTPRRVDRKPNAPVLPVAGNWYGSTLRVYSPSLDAWHIFWIDPATQFFTRQIGRAQGADIVQEGKHDDGSDMRWRFTEITTDSFRWLGERSADGGAHWQVLVEVLARRAKD